MTTRRTQVLFLVALLGVLVAIGAVGFRVFGGLVTAGYAFGMLLLLLITAGRARVAAAEARQAAGRTCTCCTSSHFDPVQVV